MANKVYLSTRKGSWITSRIQAYGMPSDQLLQRRFFFDLPRRLLDWAGTKITNMKFDHLNFGLLPSHSYLQQPPVVNDYLPYKILSGAVLVKPDVSTMSHKGNLLTSVFYLDNSDVIFYYIRNYVLIGFPTVMQ